MKQSIKSYLFISAVVVGLTSCLKDKPLFDPDKIDNVLELFNIGTIESSTTSPYPLFSYSFEVVPDDTLELTVNYAGDAVAPQDITVNVGIDENVLKAYNDSNKTAYTLLPATLYTLPTSVVIPKGQRKVALPVKMKPSSFDFSKTYALPVALQSASTGIISGSFGKVVFKVGVKNKYDGVYTLKASQGPNDRGWPTFGWSWKYDVSLITTGPNSVALHNTGYANDYTQPIVTNAAGSISRLGSFTPEFTFDPVTNKLVSVKNFILNPANGRGATINTTVIDSRFDPSSKTVYTAFFMTQPSYAPLPFYDTLTFKKAR